MPTKVREVPSCVDVILAVTRGGRRCHILNVSVCISFEATIYAADAWGIVQCLGSVDVKPQSSQRSNARSSSTSELDGRTDAGAAS